jgi:glycine hydroxymethyltransferase
MKKKEMKKIAEFIFEALKHLEDEEKLKEMKKEVHAFSAKFIK